MYDMLHNLKYEMKKMKNFISKMKKKCKLK